jgi:hypothetical protein
MPASRNVRGSAFTFRYARIRNSRRRNTAKRSLETSIRARALRRVKLANFFACGCLCSLLLLSAQVLPGVPQQIAPVTVAPFAEQTLRNPSAGCLEPPPLPGLEDYNGPLKKTVGLFGRALERKSVHPPRYKPGVMLCSLTVEGKFLLFVNDFLDPITFLSAGFDALQDHASDRDSSFGQGATGYGKRFAATLADRASSKFFKDFAYPSIFSEDPRYYRLGQGPAGQRLLHAAEHLFVAHHSDGTRMFNYSRWFGTTTAVALSNLYHPGNERGFGPMATRIGSSFATDVGFDVLREFWPEISRKFKLPFREDPNLDRPTLASGNAK